LLARQVGVPAIPDPEQYAFSSPNTGVEATYSQSAALAIASHVPVGQPHLAFVNATAQAALATLDRVAAVAQYSPTIAYATDGFSQALTAIAGAIVEQIGTQVFWVQTGGYDTHAGQQSASGRYANLLTTLDRGLSAFYTDLANHGLLGQTLVIAFSEFGRRISENGSQGTDHGAAGLMLAIGGAVRGGLYGTAGSLDPSPDNPALENDGADVRHETDFRSVYARVIDDWLGADSVQILGGNFRDAGVDFV